MHYNDVINAAKEGEIDEDIINRACRRIIAWKLKYQLNNSKEPDESDIKPEQETANNDKKTIIIIVSVMSAVVVIGIAIFIIFKFWRKKNDGMIMGNSLDGIGLMAKNQ